MPLIPVNIQGCLGLTVAHVAFAVVRSCAPPTKPVPTTDGETLFDYALPLIRAFIRGGLAAMSESAVVVCVPAIPTNAPTLPQQQHSVGHQDILNYGNCVSYGVHIASSPIASRALIYLAVRLCFSSLVRHAHFVLLP